MMRRTNYGRGLTLIETAAVVTVTSGAMALLLPSLKTAREAAKIQTCLSNLGQVTKAFIAYTHDRSHTPLSASSGYSWCGWQYGGWSGTNRAFWEEALTSWNIETSKRPLSAYMTSFKIPAETDRFTPTMEMPVFKCPSDWASVQWQWGNVENSSCQEAIPAYNDVGTSYIANWSWWDQVADDHSTSSWPDVVGIYADRMIQRYMAQVPDRFILLFEDTADWAFNGGGLGYPGLQVTGMHGEFSKHSVGYADGRAEYSYLDTRHAHDSFPYPPGPRHGKYTNSGTWSVIDWQNDHASGGRHL